MTQAQVEQVIEDRVLKSDVGILNELNVSDYVMKFLAAEHASRSLTLAKAIDPAMGRALLLVTAGVMLRAANDISENSFQEPELVNV